MGARLQSALEHGGSLRSFLPAAFVLAMILLVSAGTARAETSGTIQDKCPCWAPASSNPILVLSITLHNNSLGSNWSNAVNWANFTFGNVSGFDPTVDLASLTSSASSGVAIYNETDGTPGFSSGDTVVGTPGSWFKESDTLWHLNVSFSGNVLTLPAITGQSDIYVVVRTSGSVGNGDKWNVGLGSSMLNATYGDFPSSAFTSSDVTADTVSPTSSVDAISPYWKNSASTVSATASDSLSGVERVALWYRSSADNSTWGSWTSFGEDTSSPWEWSFNWPSGDGHYQFYSVATDNAGNVESPPSSPDSLAGYDATPPTSSVDAISPYWWNGSATTTATAGDTLSGLDHVELWYRFSADNSSWDSWTLFGTDTSSPWAWSFDWPSGEGYYQFYSVAKDNAGNVESPPSSPDTLAGYDATAPSSSVDTVSPYWKNSASTVSATASDSLSGVERVALWYRFSTDNYTWGSWTFFGNDTSSPWAWSFDWQSGDGYYQFYSVARDAVGNSESAPPSMDAVAGYDSTLPGSNAEPLPPYETSPSFTVTAAASDSLSGAWKVDLYYKLGSGAWTIYGTDYGAPWSWAFGSGSTGGDGAYQLYTRVWDGAGNYETVPSSNDTYTFVDTHPPSTDHSLSGNLGSSGWYRSNVTVTITATDPSPGSGIHVTRYSVDGGAWSDYSAPFSITDSGVHTVFCYSVDEAGNIEPQLSITVKVDTNRPSGTANPLSAYMSSRTFEVSWSASDLTSGVASVNLYYSTDGGTVWFLYGSGFTSSPIFFIATGDGEYDFNIRAYDIAGNSELLPSGGASIEATTIVDTEAAVTSHSISGTIGSNGWYTSSLIVTLTANDGLSGIDITMYRIDGGPWQDYVVPFTVSGNGEHTFAYYSLDNAGNVEVQRTATVKIDAAAPNAITGSMPSYTSTRTVSVTWSGSDVTSGLASVRLYYSVDGGATWVLYGSGFTSSPIVFIASGDGTYGFNVRAFDIAGNSEPAPAGGGSIEAGTTVDTVPPSTSDDAPPGWITLTPITVTLTPSGPPVCATFHSLDGGPWVNGTSVSITGDGAHSLTYYSADCAGNEEMPRTVTIRLDSTPPSAAANSQPTYRNSRTYEVTWNGSDATSGIAFVRLYYSANGGATWTEFGAGFTFSPIAFLAQADGPIAFSVIAYDLAGNGEPAPSGGSSVEAATTIDTASAQTAHSLSGTLGLGGWYTSSVSVTFTAIDAVSGVDMTLYSPDGGGWNVYSGSFNVIGDGVHIVWFYSTDRAGNVETSKSFAFSIDRTMPSATANPQPAFSNSRTFEVRWSGFDAASDLAYVRLYYSTNGGTAWTEFGSGFTSQSITFIAQVDATYSFSVRAYDVAGNSEPAPSSATDVEAATTVDTVATATVHSLSGALGLGGWYVSAVTVTLNASDSSSGVWYTRYTVDEGVWMDYSSPIIVSGDGLHKVTYFSVDNADNVELLNSASVKIDSTPPTASARPLPMYRNARFFEVEWSGSDASSGLANVSFYYSIDMGLTWQAFGAGFTNSPITFIAQSDGPYVFSIVAVDYAGNAEPVPVGAGDAEASTAVDTVTPTSSITPLPAYATSAEWTITAVAGDDRSGVTFVELFYRKDGGPWVSFGSLALSPYSWAFNATEAGGNGRYDFYVEAVDVAGNIQTSPTNMSSTFFDHIPPTSIAERLPGYTSAGFVVVTASAGDETSGVSSVTLYYRKEAGPWASLSDNLSPWTWTLDTRSMGDGHYEFYTIAEDMAGNVEASTAVETYTEVDTAAPETSATLSGAQGAAGWFKGSVTVILESIDSGSGVSKTFFRVDGAAWQEFTTAFAVQGDGTHSVFYYAVDRAGNAEPQGSTTVMTDSETPTSRILPLPATTGRVFEIYFTVSEKVSGVDLVWLYYTTDGTSYHAYGNFTSSPILFVADGDGSYGFYTRAVDIAGNAEDKSVKEMETTVRLGDNPATLDDTADTFNRLRSALDFTMILLAILVILNSVLAALGLGAANRRVKRLTAKFEAFMQVTQPKQPPTLGTGIERPKGRMGESHEEELPEDVWEDIPEE